MLRLLAQLDLTLNQGSHKQSHKRHLLLLRLTVAGLHASLT